MIIPLDRVTAVARAVIAETRRAVEMVSALPTDGGSALNLTRADASEFEHELREKLREAFLSHSFS